MVKITKTSQQGCKELREQIKKRELSKKCPTCGGTLVVPICNSSKVVGYGFLWSKKKKIERKKCIECRCEWEVEV